MGFYRNQIMENAKKIIILCILSCFFITCAQEEKTNFKKVKYDLYKNLNGDLFLKVKNLTPLNPNSNSTDIQDSIYLDKVYMTSLEEERKIKDVIDTASFLKINRTGNYYKDKNYVYIYVTRPHPVPFYCFNSSNVNFFGQHDDYMVKDNNEVYYQGNRIEGIDPSKFELIYWKNKKGTFEYELYTNGETMYIEDIKLDVERLIHMDLPKKFVDSLKTVFFTSE